MNGWNNASMRKLTLAQRVVLVGDVARLQQFCVQQLGAEGGVPVVGAFGPNSLGVQDDTGVVRGTADDAILYMQSKPADLVLVTMYSLTAEQARQLVQYCSDSATCIFDLPLHVAQVWHNVQMSCSDGILMLHPQTVAYDKMYSRIAKRTMDILVSVILLLTLMPILILIVLVASKASQAGSALVRGKRTARDGSQFRCQLFRTQHRQADKSYGFGSVLLSTGLYSWPLLFKVLSGRMTLVGPKLHELAIDAPDAKTLLQFMSRHRVKAGWISWADQVLEEDATLDEHRHAEMDYVLQWSMWQDLRTLLHV